jgi:hypothetical protein
MFGAMVVLTLTMSAALALQFGGWLWSVNPRLLVVVVAIALLGVGGYLVGKDYFIKFVPTVTQLFSRKTSER